VTTPFYGTITPAYSTPYLTIQEFKNAPTAVDIDDLINAGSQAVQDAELANVIARASSWVDTIVGQVLAATLDTDMLRVRVGRDGYMRIHPRYWPILSVEALSYGATPQTMTALTTLSSLWVEQMDIVVPTPNIGWSFSGPLQFTTAMPGGEVYVQVQYVNGYPNALLSSPTIAGATSLPLNSLVGFNPGMTFTVYDNATTGSTETLQVASTFVPTSGAGSLPLAAATANAHSAGVSVSALPPAIKQATVFLTAALLKARGNATVTMGSLSPSSQVAQMDDLGPDVDRAHQLLWPYRRIR
jgi:hypothetical protein